MLSGLSVLLVVGQCRRFHAWPVKHADHLRAMLHTCGSLPTPPPWCAVDFMSAWVTVGARVCLSPPGKGEEKGWLRKENLQELDEEPWSKRWLFRIISAGGVFWRWFRAFTLTSQKYFGMLRPVSCCFECVGRFNNCVDHKSEYNQTWQVVAVSQGRAHTHAHTPKTPNFQGSRDSSLFNASIFEAGC